MLITHISFQKMANDKAVEDHLGKEFVSKILDHASEGMKESDLTQIIYG